MKKRDLLKVFLLSIVTLGIYCIYWMYATRKELVALTGNTDDIPPVIVLFLPLIAGVPLIISMIVFGGLYEGHETPAAITIAFVLLVFLIIAAVLLLPLWWFWKYCKAAVKVTKGGIEFAPLYVLYVAISWFMGIMPAWMLIVQNDFNKVAVESGEPPHPPAGQHTQHHHTPHHDHHASA